MHQFLSSPYVINISILIYIISAVAIETVVYTYLQKSSHKYYLNGGNSWWCVRYRTVTSVTLWKPVIGNYISQLQNCLYRDDAWCQGKAVERKIWMCCIYPEI